MDPNRPCQMDQNNRATSSTQQFNFFNQNDFEHEPQWADMDCFAATRKAHSQSQRYYADENKKLRRAKKNPHRKRGGKKRHRRKEDFKRDPSLVNNSLANSTRLSEKAKVHLIERNDNVNSKHASELLKLYRNNGWSATASPARPSERSEKGTTSGVSVAVKSYIDNRPASIRKDVEGSFTQKRAACSKTFPILESRNKFARRLLRVWDRICGTEPPVPHRHRLHYERR